MMTEKAGEALCDAVRAGDVPTVADSLDRSPDLVGARADGALE